MSDKELSPLARQLLGGSGAVTMFTQTEFDEALALEQAYMIKMAVNATKEAIWMERKACAQMVQDKADEEDEDGYACKILEDLAQAIMNRIPSQRQ